MQSVAQGALESRGARVRTQKGGFCALITMPHAISKVGVKNTNALQNYSDNQGEKKDGKVLAPDWSQGNDTPILTG